MHIINNHSKPRLPGQMHYSAYLTAHKKNILGILRFYLVFFYEELEILPLHLHFFGSF